MDKRESRRKQRMTMRPTTPEELRQMEGDLLEVATKLRKTWEDWEKTKYGELDLEVDKAKGYILYLKVIFASRLQTQYEQSVQAVRNPDVAAMRRKMMNRRKSQKSD